MKRYCKTVCFVPDLLDEQETPGFLIDVQRYGIFRVIDLFKLLGNTDYRYSAIEREFLGSVMNHPGFLVVDVNELDVVMFLDAAYQLLDSHHVQLRAERAASGNGRVYTITITCSDSKGFSSSQTVTVKVPKSQS